MASSNKHWPSMFKKSKLSTGFQRTPYSLGGGDEKSGPEPKPRWNPKPEQIRILEAIFNSGMVNPPREEIRKIRTQLQEYGQVGDANVFYWFQNRKSRSKNKLRLQKNKTHDQQTLPQITPPSSLSSSSSSSNLEKSSPQAETILPHKVVPNSPTSSAKQTYFQTQNEIPVFHHQLPLDQHFFCSFPMQQQQHHHHIVEGGVVDTTQGFYLSAAAAEYPPNPNMIQVPPQPQQNNIDVVPCTSLLSGIMGYGITASSKNDMHNDQDILGMMNYNTTMHHQDPQFGGGGFCHTSTSNGSTLVPPPITQLEGVGDAAAVCTVFINNVAFEVAEGPFNVREAFGDGAVLFDISSGNPVLTDEWGFTLHSLRHAASYYLI